jgi:hypothetical protein
VTKFLLFLIFGAFALLVFQKPSVAELQPKHAQQLIKSIENDHAIRPTKNIALIYKGEGSCIEDCSESAALVAEWAGLVPVYVSPNEVDLKIFDKAAIWIQPGGESLIVSDAMSADLKRAVREFVEKGGGYVGFCAGAFFADDNIHGTGSKGLNLIPAWAIDKSKKYNA